MKRQISGLVMALAFHSAPAFAGDEADSACMRPVEQPAIKYIGNAESRKFHKPSCPYARVMAPNKRMQFYFRCQAVASGHSPCHFCLPPVWKTVKGCVLTPLHRSECELARPLPKLPADPP